MIAETKKEGEQKRRKRTSRKLVYRERMNNARESIMTTEMHHNATIEDYCYHVQKLTHYHHI
jgi:hypothetical protein